MPKVEYTAAKGVFQSSGTGVELSGGANDDLTLSIKTLQGTVSTAASATLATTGTVPAGALILGSQVKIISADTDTDSATTCTLSGTQDTMNITGALTIDPSTAGASAKGTIPHDGVNVTSAASTITATFDQALDGDGSVQITVLYLAVA